MRVAVVAEFYPRAADPVLGVWAHRQALAAREAGADVRVLVLHRPVPPLRTVKDGPMAAAQAMGAMLRQPRHAVLDGLEVEYVPFLAPPRPRWYGHWGAWAAPSLAVALRALRRRWRFDLVHAHNAVPAGEAVRRAAMVARTGHAPRSTGTAAGPGAAAPRAGSGGRAANTPLVLSVHGGDVFHTAPRQPGGEAAVRAAFGAARLVLANSAGVEQRCRALGARETRVVRLGADAPPAGLRAERPTLVTVGHLVARKRHADVLRALWLLRDRHPDLRYLVVGDGPEREPLTRLAADLGLDGRVELTGQLAHTAALDRLATATIFVMPSTDEAFGVAYVEAMAAGLPAVGALGEPGPAEIAAAGPGLLRVPPGDPEALARTLDDLLGDRRHLAEVGALARATARTAFSWEACGRATVNAYAEALR